MFLAGGAGGYTFTGQGSNDTLDLTAAGSGTSVSVPAGTVSGLTSGGDDHFSGITTFDGSSLGGTTFTASSANNETFSGPGNGNTFVAGSGNATFNGGPGSGNTLDFSPLVASSGHRLLINSSGITVDSVATNHAALGSVYTFSGISTFTGAGDGFTTFFASAAGGVHTFNGNGSGNTLDFSASSSATVVSVPLQTVQVGTQQDSFSGITGFVGAGAGDTAFMAGGGGGYTFSASGAGNTLDLSAAGTGVSVSVPDGTVTGLNGGGGSDQFSGIGSFVGSASGHTTLVAGSSSLSFTGQGAGNELDFSQVATSPAAPLVVNVSGGPASVSPYGAVATNRAVAGSATYSFGDVSSFAGAAFGHTTFLAGGAGGYTFGGAAFGNVLDLSAAPAGTTVALHGDSAGDPGTVSGLTTGTDSFYGIQQIAGPVTIVPASVTGVTSTLANGSYGVGKLVPVTVSFSEPVTVTGTPRLSLNSGGTAVYASGSGTNTLTFDYTVGAGENSADLDYPTTTALSLNGGAIDDAADNPAYLTLPSPGAAGSLGANKDLVIDTTAPTVTNVTSTTVNGAYNVGHTVTVTVTFSEPVYVTGTPQLALNSGGTALYSSGSRTGTLSFTYTVGAGQNSADLDYTTTTALSLNGGAIDDAADNPANLVLPSPGAAGSLGANKAIVIDTAAPAFTQHPNVTVPAAGLSGAVVTYSVTVADPNNTIAQLTVSCAPASGSTFPLGANDATRTTTVTCNASDPAGTTRPRCRSRSPSGAGTT